VKSRLGCFAVWLGLVALAEAQTNYRWIVLTSGNASASWSTAGNWSPSGPADGTDNTATFNTTITMASALSLDGNRTIGDLFFGTPSPGTAAWTLSLTFDTHRLLSWPLSGFLGFPRADGQRSSLQI